MPSGSQQADFRCEICEKAFVIYTNFIFPVSQKNRDCPSLLFLKNFVSTKFKSRILKQQL